MYFILRRSRLSLIKGIEFLAEFLDILLVWRLTDDYWFLITDNGTGEILIADAVKNAAATGAMNLTEYDSLSGLLPIEALRRRIDGGWERQHLIRP